MRIGSPSSDPVGIYIESTCKDSHRRISLRAQNPLVNIPAQHFSLEELAHALGLTIPPRKKAERKR